MHLEIGDYKPGMQQQLQHTLSLIATNKKRKEVMQWLPEKDRMLIKLPLTPQQNKYLSELSLYFETEHVVTQGTLDRLIRYRQICLDPKLLNLKGESPKTQWIIQYIKDYPKKPIIIFSKFTSYIKQLQMTLGLNKIELGLIIGETPIEKRKNNS